MIRLFRHYVPKSLVLLGVADGLILFLSVYLAVSPPFIDSGPTDKLLVGALWKKALIYTVIMMSMMAVVGLYQREMRDDFRGVSLRLGVAVTLGLGLIAIVLYVRPWLTIGGSATLFAVTVSILGIAIFRLLLYRFTERDAFKRRVLVLGAGARAAQAAELETRGEDHETALLGFVPVTGEKRHLPERQCLDMDGSLPTLCERLEVEELVVAIDEDVVDFPVSELLACKMNGVEVVDVVAFIERRTGRLQLDALRPGTMVFAEGFVQAILKGYIHRFFDIVIGLIALFFAPNL